MPQLGPCASSGRAWRLRAARCSQGEAQPLGSPPLPQGLKRAASKVVDSAAFDRADGAAERVAVTEAKKRREAATKQMEEQVGVVGDSERVVAAAAVRGWP